MQRPCEVLAELAHRRVVVVAVVGLGLRAGLGRRLRGRGAAARPDVAVAPDEVAVLEAGRVRPPLELDRVPALALVPELRLRAGGPPEHAAACDRGHDLTALRAAFRHPTPLEFVPRGRRWMGRFLLSGALCVELELEPSRQRFRVATQRHAVTNQPNTSATPLPRGAGIGEQMPQFSDRCPNPLRPVGVVVDLAPILAAVLLWSQAVPSSHAHDVHFLRALQDGLQVILIGLDDRAS
mmetsp:Transcript_4366/g.11847  ORF Transcript_4366/g.11847 Transcript_4366/m.11847 type:complete len:238 (-) Transcript_4366:365-1078(-)